MEFNSFQYIAFLAAVFIPYYFLPQNFRKIMLLCASFAFYMCWSVKYSVLMLISILTTYLGAVLIKKYKNNKKLFLFASVGINLFILFWFKYLNFVISNINLWFSQEISFLNVLLPVGISFYTFQAIGYVVDVYRDEDLCKHNLLDYALFISFFPQLVAGPIERSTNMLKQFSTKAKFDIDNIKDGASLIIFGLFEKIVIASWLAIIVDGIFTNYKSMNALFLIIGIVFFAVQIYADFSSYTNIARGSAKLFGINLMRNFNSPYLSNSIAEFWTRWHISLTSWFQDYIFQPFVWNSNNKIKASYLGVLLVFFISGFWHGASWTFVIWGCIHAFYRIFGMLTKKSRKNFYKKIGLNQKSVIFKLGQVATTFSLVCITYIFFRSESLQIAFDYILGILSFNQISYNSVLEVLNITNFDVCLGFTLVVLSFGLDYLRLKKDGLLEFFNKQNVITQSVIYSLVIISIVVIGVYGNKYVVKPFIYFQF